MNDLGEALSYAWGRMKNRTGTSVLISVSDLRLICDAAQRPPRTFTLEELRAANNKVEWLHRHSIKDFIDYLEQEA